MFSIESEVMSVGLEGMKGHPIVVEADVRHEKEMCVIIGLPDAPMKESKERILSCLHTLEFDISNKKITIHLSPADKRKTGAGHDCAMLVAVLQKMVDEPFTIEKNTCFLAGLSLKGKLLPYHGIIPSIQQAIKLGFTKIIVPPIELTFLPNSKHITFIQIETVSQLLEYLRGQVQLPLSQPVIFSFDSFYEKNNNTLMPQADFSAVRGHAEAKRALEIAAAGGHHVLLNGPPGCGKSMLADTFHTIFPDFTDEEMLEVYSIYHLAKEARGFSKRPPYRHPHHSASAISLIGGGTFPKPGEISLAHFGVLFLDELGEFSQKALDMLRQPMETGEVTISRVRQTVTYPAGFTLIAATNPCPCGYFGSNERYCTCTPQQIRAYQLKASGPLLDRFDFMLTLKSVGLKEETSQETSVHIRERITNARLLQKQRYHHHGLNGNVPFSLFMKTSQITEQQLDFLHEICFTEKWSNRTQTKIIRIARTIADLNGDAVINNDVLQEAIEWKKRSEKRFTVDGGNDT